MKPNFKAVSDEVSDVRLDGMQPESLADITFDSEGLTDEEEEEEPAVLRRSYLEAYALCANLNHYTLRPALEAAGTPHAQIRVFEQTLETLQNRVKHQVRHTIAVVGEMGVGKSTFTNALVNVGSNGILPSGAEEKACTSFLTEVEYEDREDFGLVIQYCSREEWMEELDHCRYNTAHRSQQPEGDADRELVENARLKFETVYPDMKTKLEVLRDEDFKKLLEREYVENVLGSSQIMDISSTDRVQSKLRDLGRSPTNGQHAVYPLIKRVTVQGRFAGLETGMVMLDLPGHGDLDHARQSVATVAFQDARTVFLVTGMARSSSKESIRKLLRDCIAGGKQLVVILTQADRQVEPGSLEGGLTPEDREDIEAAESSARQEMETITAKIRKYERLRGKAKPQNQQAELDSRLQRLRNELPILRQQSVSKIYRIVALRARVNAVRSMRAKILEVAKEIAPTTWKSHTELARDFCVGSKDALRIEGGGLYQPDVFSNAMETHIPDVRAFIRDLGQKRGVQDAVELMDSAKAVFGEISRSMGSPQASAVGIEGLPRIEEESLRIIDDGIKDIRGRLSEVELELSNYTDRAERESEDVLKRSLDAIRTYHTYRACMRRNGIYKIHNINIMLTQSILDGLTEKWATSFVDLKQCLQVKIVDNLHRFLDNTEGIAESSSDPATAAFVKGAIDTMNVKIPLRDMEREGTNILDQLRNKGMSSFPEVLKNELLPMYKSASASGFNRGPGVWARAKKADIDWMSQHKHVVFKAIRTEMTREFDMLCQDLQTRLLKEYEHIIAAIYAAKESPTSRPTPVLDEHAKELTKFIEMKLAEFEKLRMSICPETKQV